MRLAHKILNRFRREIRQISAFLRARMFDTKPTEEDVLDAWQGRPTNLEACVEQWIASKPIAFLDDTNPATWNREEIVREADLLLRGQALIFDEDCDLTRPNRWHQDPLTRQAWPSDVHFTRFNVFHLSHDGITDIRRLWELGRFGWALPLSRALTLTREVKYADAWWKYFDDFVQKAPPEFGPHWLNAMEVAIRLIQWSRALTPLLAMPGAAFRVPRSLLPSLLAHGRYVRNHLEWTPYGRTNHYIADLVGLLSIATFVPQFRESHEWLQFSRHHLVQEMEVQTDVEGFHAEASTAYHHFVVELYTLVEHLDRQHNLQFPPHFHKRLQQMRETDAALRGPENLDPRIGDDDSGSLGISNLKSQISNSGESASRGFTSSGIYILRSDTLSCHIAAGPNGQEGVGGHAHNDKLSIVVRLRGRPVIIDPGTFCYSADLTTRNAFRSTSSHNTIRLDGEEQNLIEDWRMLRDRTQAVCSAWSDSATETIFIGQHHGYESLSAIHRRSVQLDKNRHRLVVLDEILSTHNHVINFYLHFDPSLTRKNIRIEPNRIALPGADLIFPDAPPLALIDTICSPVYGQQASNLTLHFRCQTTGNWRLPWEFHAIV